MDYILFGIQGSGKGTQGKILAEKLGAAYFEMGGELRRLSAEDSELGRKVKSIIDGGNLVPNRVVMEIVENFVEQQQGSAGIIFDGIPRNEEQNASFEALLQKMGREYIGIYFELSREEAENRLLKRRICTVCKKVYPSFYQGKTCEQLWRKRSGPKLLKCGGKLLTRADDNVDAIRTRIDIFYKETMLVIENWKTLGKVLRIEGEGTIEEVTKELFSLLKI